MKTILTGSQITLLSLALIATACSKKQFSQFDLDNARKEGAISAQPSANRLALLKAQKDFAPKARIAVYMADTIQRGYWLQGILAKTEKGLHYYNAAIRNKIVDKYVDTTKAAITAAFGAPTNTDGAKLSFATQIIAGSYDTYGKKNNVVIGLIKLNKRNSKTTTNGSQIKSATGDSLNHVEKSVTYTVGGYEFAFKKASTATTPALSTVEAGSGPEFSVHPVKLVLRKLPKRTALDETLIADNLYTTSAILYAINDALTKAIDATK